MANVGTGNSVSEAEFSWFQQRSGVALNAPLNDHKRVVMEALIGKHEQGMRELEIQWLQKTTGSTSKDMQSLWQEMVNSISQAPSRTINENKFRYFKNVAT